MADPQARELVVTVSSPRRRRSRDAFAPVLALFLAAAASPAGEFPTMRAPRPADVVLCDPADCSDGDPTTDDGCDPIVGCIHEVPPCFDVLLAIVQHDRMLCRQTTGAPRNIRKRLVNIATKLGSAGTLIGKAARLQQAATRSKSAKNRSRKETEAAVALVLAQNVLQRLPGKAAKLPVGPCVTAVMQDVDRINDPLGELKNGIADATTRCAACNHNGVRDGREACDGTDVARLTCLNLGFDAGTLACTDGCRLDTTACVVCEGAALAMPVCAARCGNGKRDHGEECDGFDLGDTLPTCPSPLVGRPLCTSDCKLDTSLKTPTRPDGRFAQDIISTERAGCHERLCGDGVVDTPEQCETSGTDVDPIQGFGDLGQFLGANCGCCRSGPTQAMPQTGNCVSCHNLGDPVCHGPCNVGCDPQQAPCPPCSE